MLTIDWVVGFRFLPRLRTWTGAGPGRWGIMFWWLWFNCALHGRESGMEMLARLATADDDTPTGSLVDYFIGEMRYGDRIEMEGHLEKCEVCRVKFEAMKRASARWVNH